jgi:hypothetical protein
MSTPIFSPTPFHLESMPSDTNDENRTIHINDELVFANHALMENHIDPVTTLNHQGNHQGPPTAITANGDGSLQSLKLVFEGTQVFSLQVSPDLPFNMDIITLGDRMYITRGSVSRLLWPETTLSVMTALKQNPLPDSQSVKTEQVVISNLPSLHNEILSANLLSTKNNDGEQMTKLNLYDLADLPKLADHYSVQHKDLVSSSAKEVLKAWKAGDMNSLSRKENRCLIGAESLAGEFCD